MATAATRGLLDAVDRLGRSHPGVPVEVIRQMLLDEQSALGATATVKQYLPVLAERRVRDRLADVCCRSLPRRERMDSLAESPCAGR